VKDHWLPQFYLREFAIPGFTRKQDAEIWVTDLDSESCSIKRIQDVAQEAHFYSFVDAKGKPSRRIDDKLTDLEDRASRAFRIIARGSADLNQSIAMKQLLSLFLATILLRTPDQQQKTIEQHQRLRDIFDAAPKSSSGRPLVDYVFQGALWVPLDTSNYFEWNSDDEETLKRLFAEHIEVLGRPLANRLFSKRWVVFHTNQPVFFTSDAPLIKIDDQGAQCGIDSPNAMLFFPISPSRLLYMEDRQQGDIDGFCKMSFDRANDCNVVIGKNARRFLFSQTDLP
jgi:hypothetical protein